MRVGADLPEGPRWRQTWKKHKALKRESFDRLGPPTFHLSFRKELGGYHTAPPKYSTFQRSPKFRWEQAPHQCLSNCLESLHLRSQCPNDPLEPIDFQELWASEPGLMKFPFLGLGWLTLPLERRQA